MLESIESASARLANGVQAEVFAKGLEYAFPALGSLERSGFIKVNLGPEDYSMGKGQKTQLLFVREEKYAELRDCVKSLSQVVVVSKPTTYFERYGCPLRGLTAKAQASFSHLANQAYWVIPMYVNREEKLAAYGLRVNNSTRRYYRRTCNISLIANNFTVYEAFLGGMLIKAEDYGQIPLSYIIRWLEKMPSSRPLREVVDCYVKLDEEALG